MKDYGEVIWLSLRGAYVYSKKIKVYIIYIIAFNFEATASPAHIFSPNLPLRHSVLTTKKNVFALH